jgi:DNA-binding IclR family transcriptional regulator
MQSTERKRVHLRGRTLKAYSGLVEFGPGGATAADIGKRTGLRSRQVAASLRWLKRVGFVRYGAGEIWQLTDDSIFCNGETHEQRSTEGSTE